MSDQAETYKVETTNNENISSANIGGAVQGVM
jgi:hypothetical protein